MSVSSSEEGERVAKKGRASSFEARRKIISGWQRKLTGLRVPIHPNYGSNSAGDFSIVATNWYTPWPRGLPHVSACTTRLANDACAGLFK